MTPPKKRERNAEATRRTLLTAATRVFAQVGFAGARVDDIADRAGVNKRMIYAYFGDKEGLYREVLASRLGQVQVSRSSGGSDPRAEAIALIREYFQLLADDPPFARLLTWELLSGEGRAHEILVESVTPGLDLLQDILRRGIERGVFRSDLDHEQVRMSITSLCLGYFLQRPVLAVARRRKGAKVWNDPQILEHTCRLLFDGITQHPVSP